MSFHRYASLIVPVAVSIGAASASAQSVPAPSPTASPTIEEQIATAQARVEQLRQLKRLREEQASLETALGSSPPPAPAVPKTTVPTTPAAEKETDSASASKQGEATGESKNLEDTPGTSIGGVKFGVGLGFTYDLGKHRRVKSASIVNGVVRISEEDDVKARLMLESHYFFLPDEPFLGLQPGDWGIGPFIAVQGGPSDVIEGIGGGLMVGFKRIRSNPASRGAQGTGDTKKDQKEDNTSFNIGLGVFYDLGVQTLGDGIEQNKALPAGENQNEIRFQKRSQSGFMIMSSYAF